MGHEDWLQVTAEVSIAFAGFSGLAAGLRDRSGRRTKINQSRLLTIVETSLSALLFCLVPVVLHGFGMSEGSAYRLSAFLFLCGFVPTCWRGFRRYLEAAGESVVDGDGRLGLYSIAGALTSLVAGVLCAVGIPGHALSTLYLLALAGTLVIGAINFAGFVSTLADVEADESA